MRSNFSEQKQLQRISQREIEEQSQLDAELAEINKTHQMQEVYINALPKQYGDLIRQMQSKEKDQLVRDKIENQVRYSTQKLKASKSAKLADFQNTVNIAVT